MGVKDSGTSSSRDRKEDQSRLTYAVIAFKMSSIAWVQVRYDCGGKCGKFEATSRST